MPRGSLVVLFHKTTKRINVKLAFATVIDDCFFRSQKLVDKPKQFFRRDLFGNCHHAMLIGMNQVTRMHDKRTNLDRHIDFNPTDMRMTDHGSRGTELEAKIFAFRPVTAAPGARTAAADMPWSQK